MTPERNFKTLRAATEVRWSQQTLERLAAQHPSRHRRRRRVQVGVWVGLVALTGALPSLAYRAWWRTPAVDPPASPAPPRPVASAPAPEPAVAPPPPRTQPSSRRRAPGPARWRELASRGDYARAYASLEVAAGQVDDRVEDLLLAADAARFSHHPRAASEFLGRVVRDHASDARAALAAFTRGTLLLHQLGEPAAAAQSFAEARRLDARDAVSEDALAREIESLDRAGQSARAQARRDEYLRRYPSGRWAPALRAKRIDP